MKHRAITSWILAMGFYCGLADAAKADHLVDRLNKIFYWQMSTELNLSPKSEKDMIAIMDDVQNKRHSALEEREQVMAALANSRKDKASETDTAKLLDRLQKSLSTLASLDSEEFTRLKAVLGTEALARFYLVRDSVTQRIREAVKEEDKKK